MRIIHPKAMLFVFSAYAASTSACNDLDQDLVGERSAETPAHRASPPAIMEKVATPVADAAVPMADDWEAWVAAEVDRLRQHAPQLYAAIRDLAPRSTRAGFPRFTGPDVRHPEAAVLLLDRLVNGNETAQVRAALVEALPRTGGAFGPAVLDLMEREKDARVREVMVGSLRHADASSALRGLGRGLADADPGVRAEAARTLARRRDGAELSDALLSAASDPDPDVQLASVRTLGVLQIEAAEAKLVDLLAAGDADLRLHALRSLGRIDPERAAKRPEVSSMRDDPDARVAKLASELYVP